MNPHGFDRWQLLAKHVSDVTVDPLDSRYHQARSRYFLLVQALEHHRPVAALIVAQEGPAAVSDDEARRRHLRCAERLSQTAIDSIVAAAEDNDDRTHWLQRRRDVRRELDADAEYPALLLRVLSLGLTSVTDRGWAQTERRENMSSDLREERPSQQSWRSEQIRVAGHEVGLRIDLLSDRTSSAAGVCRTVSLRTVAEPTSDTCSIGGYIDKRDGWPIILTVSRSARGPGDLLESQMRLFHRLAPLEGYVPPPNPCARPRGR